MLSLRCLLNSQMKISNYQFNKQIWNLQERPRFDVDLGLFGKEMLF